MKLTLAVLALLCAGAVAQGTPNKKLLPDPLTQGKGNFNVGPPQIPSYTHPLPDLSQLVPKNNKTIPDLSNLIKGKGNVTVPNLPTLPAIELPTGKGGPALPKNLNLTLQVPKIPEITTKPKTLSFEIPQMPQVNLTKEVDLELSIPQLPKNLSFIGQKTLNLEIPQVPQVSLTKEKELNLTLFSAPTIDLVTKPVTLNIPIPSVPTVTPRTKNIPLNLTLLNLPPKVHVPINKLPINLAIPQFPKIKVEMQPAKQFNFDLKYPGQPEVNLTRDVNLNLTVPQFPEITIPKNTLPLNLNIPQQLNVDVPKTKVPVNITLPKFPEVEVPHKQVNLTVPVLQIPSDFTIPHKNVSLKFNVPQVPEVNVPKKTINWEFNVPQVNNLGEFKQVPIDITLPQVNLPKPKNLTLPEIDLNQLVGDKLKPSAELLQWLQDAAASHVKNVTDKANAGIGNLQQNAANLLSQLPKEVSTPKLPSNLNIGVVQAGPGKTVKTPSVQVPDLQLAGLLKHPLMN